MNDELRVTISCQGKFQAFRLAENLADQGVLNALYTVYPKFKIPPYRIPLEKVKSANFLGAITFLNSRFGLPISDSLISDVFDRTVALSLKKPSDRWVFHGWSGYCEKSLQKAKKLGGVSVVDRPCPHIEFQRALEAEERSRLLGRKFSFGRNKVHERMIREYQLADHIFVPSNYSRQTFLERGFSEDKIKLLPLCNEKMTQPPEKPRVFDKLRVLFVGGNFYRKGTYYLLKAWQELALKDAELVVKEGNIPVEFSHLLKSPGLKIVSRHLSDDELGELYQSANLFVLPSADDGFGMVVVEAMRTGLPVIVSSNVGASDIIESGEDGFIFPFRDVEILKEKIKYFYDNPNELRRMGEKAVKKSEQYTPEAYARRAISVYSKISS